MTVDFPDWMTQAQAQLAAYTSLTTEIAAAIATGNPLGTPGGVPLLHGFADLTKTTVNLTAGQTLNEFTSFGSPAYWLSFTPSYTTTNGADPFLTVKMRWYDSHTNVIMAEEHWYLPIGPVGSFLPVFGRGPVKCTDLEFILQNNDPAQGVTVAYEITEMTQHIGRDDWRTGNNFAAVPGYNIPAMVEPSALCLGAEAIVFAGAGTQTRLLPLYAGQATISLNISAAATVTVNIQAAWPVGSSYSLNNVYSGTAIPPINVYLPRSPCIISFTASAACTCTYGIVAQEYAS